MSALHAQRLKQLRNWMQQRAVDTLLLPHADAYHNEFLPPHAERLYWLSGFSGSAGLIIVTPTIAALFVDGRYELQAQEETDQDTFHVVFMRKDNPQNWLAERITPHHRIGFPSWNFTVAEITQWQRVLSRKQPRWCTLDSDPIDTLWGDRPSPPPPLLTSFPLTYAGSSAAEKIDTIAQQHLRQQGIQGLLITAPDCLSWLLNVRSREIPGTPLVLARALLWQDARLTLFCDATRIPREVHQSWEQRVAVRPPDELMPQLRACNDQQMQYDPQDCPYALIQGLENSHWCAADDPCKAIKAVKHTVEIRAMQAAHVRDGLALVRFLYWLEQQPDSVDEYACAQQLQSFRAQDKAYLEDSFPTIAAVGAHAASVHHRTTVTNTRPLAQGRCLLLDSGAQYLDGTTDVTRTIMVGEPEAAYCRDYTLVLKAHIALASTLFPPHAVGAQLDGIARRVLWQYGEDYAHGTGHGVGCALSVHEGPQSISPRDNRTVMKEGMIVSIEPGLYRVQSHGVRIENLAVIAPSTATPGMLCFRPLTLAPIDLRPLVLNLLSAEEIAWINAYHREVYRRLKPLMDEPALCAWFQRSTAALDGQAN